MKSNAVIFIVVALAIVIVIAIVTKVGPQPVLEVAELGLVTGWQVSERMAEHINQAIQDLGNRITLGLAL